MNILIMHRVPYQKINYHLAIDHDLHKVTYIGLEKNLAGLPDHIRYKTITRPGLGGVAEEVLAALQAHDTKIDLVISMSDTEALEAAKVREALGIPGTSVNDVIKLRNNLTVKQLIARHGIHVPRGMTLTDFNRSAQIGWGGKTVLKPLTGNASIEAKMFANPELLRQALRSRETGIQRLDMPEPANGHFEVEEYIPGDILHFDGLIKNGRIITMLSSAYIGDCFAYAEGQPLGSVQCDTSAEDETWVQKIIGAINMSHGVFHLEVMSDKSGKVFLGIANSPGGGSVVETFRLATGVNLITAELRILMGENIVVKQRKKSRKFGWFTFPGHHLPAGHWNISGHTEYLEHPTLVRYEMLSKSSPLPREITYQSKVVPLSGIINGSSTEEMGNWLRRMFRDVKINPVYKP